jgi:hypothetical protein
VGLYARTDVFDADGYELTYYRDEDSKTVRTDSTQGQDPLYQFISGITGRAVDVRMKPVHFHLEGAYLMLVNV